MRRAASFQIKLQYIPLNQYHNHSHNCLSLIAKCSLLFKSVSHNCLSLIAKCSLLFKSVSHNCCTSGEFWVLTRAPSLSSPSTVVLLNSSNLQSGDACSLHYGTVHKWRQLGGRGGGGMCQWKVDIWGGGGGPLQSWYQPWYSKRLGKIKAKWRKKPLHVLRSAPPFLGLKF